MWSRILGVSAGMSAPRWCLGHHHGDRAHGTLLAHSAVPDALMAFHDGGLPVQKAQHIALGTYVHAGAAADARFKVDLRMLRSWPVGEQLPVLCRLDCRSFALL